MLMQISKYMDCVDLLESGIAVKKLKSQSKTKIMVYLMEEIKNERNERLPISFIKANNILQFIENT